MRHSWSRQDVPSLAVLRPDLVGAHRYLESPLSQDRCQHQRCDDPRHPHRADRSGVAPEDTAVASTAGVGRADHQPCSHHHRARPQRTSTVHRQGRQAVSARQAMTRRAVVTPGPSRPSGTAGRARRAHRHRTPWPPRSRPMRRPPSRPGRQEGPAGPRQSRRSLLRRPQRSAGDRGPMTAVRRRRPPSWRRARFSACAATAPPLPSRSFSRRGTSSRRTRRRDRCCAAARRVRRRPVDRRPGRAGARRARCTGRARSLRADAPWT